MMEAIQRRHFRNGHIVAGDFVFELGTAIDAFEDFYSNYQPSTYSTIAFKMALYAGVPDFLHDPSKCFISRHEWQKMFPAIQVSISNKYTQVLDYSMILLLDSLGE